jgi:hypothetical protein
MVLYDYGRSFQVVYSHDRSVSLLACRDLKPANILLADKQKNKSKLKGADNVERIYEGFEKGYLVAKVSFRTSGIWAAFSTSNLPS